MDHGPAASVQPRGGASGRHDSASSDGKNRTRQPDRTGTQQATEYTSSPSPSNTSHRSTSAHSSPSSTETQHIEAKYARYTNAPPQYTEQQYEGKSEDEANSMRMSDYAKEISRMMGRQIVEDMKIAQHKADNKPQ